MITGLKAGIKVIATGSSSFELAGKAGAPLTGRKRFLLLLPFSQRELSYVLSPYELKQRLSEFLIFGTYPEVFSMHQGKKNILTWKNWLTLFC